MYGPLPGAEKRRGIVGHLAKDRFSDEEERDAHVQKIAAAKEKAGYVEIKADKAFDCAKYDREFAQEG